MIKLKLQLGDNLQNILRNYQKFSRRTPIIVNDRVFAQSRRRIRTTKKDPEGKSWRKLDRDTIDKKGHSKILWNSGELYRSFSKQKNQVSINSPYAAIQHFGSTQNRIPARPFLGIDPDEKMLDKRLQDFWRKVNR